MAASAVSWLEEQGVNDSDEAVVVGIRRDQMRFTPVMELAQETDWRKRVWVGKSIVNEPPRLQVGFEESKNRENLKSEREDPNGWWKGNWELMRVLAMIGVEEGASEKQIASVGLEEVQTSRAQENTEHMAERSERGVKTHL
ncbi:hypothetical protein HDU93_000258 [Gonapodya sp. JEL0774]|nr:hypothetical protein HDU93_000258 [Gonapodya sp. JEL0774]